MSNQAQRSLSPGNGLSASGLGTEKSNELTRARRPRALPEQPPQARGQEGLGLRAGPRRGAWGSRSQTSAFRTLGLSLPIQVCPWNRDDEGDGTFLLSKVGNGETKPGPYLPNPLTMVAIRAKPWKVPRSALPMGLTPSPLYFSSCYLLLMLCSEKL